MQKALRWIVLVFFDAHAVLFPLSLLSTSFIKGLYYKTSYPHVWKWPCQLNVLPYPLSLIYLPRSCLQPVMPRYSLYRNSFGVLDHIRWEQCKINVSDKDWSWTNYLWKEKSCCPIAASKFLRWNTVAGVPSSVREILGLCTGNGNSTTMQS